MKYLFPLRISKESSNPTRNIVDANGEYVAFNVEKEIAALMVAGANQMIELFELKKITPMDILDIL